MTVRRLRVLIFITKLELGGAQRKQIYFTRHLPHDQFDVRLLAGSGGMLDSEAREQTGGRVILWDSVKHRISPFWDITSVFKLVRFLKRESIDLLYTHSSKAGVIGRIAGALAGVKVIHHYHGFAFHDRQNPILRAFYVAVESFASRFADLHLADSRQNIQKALKNGIGRADRFEVLRCGIDVEELTREPPDPAWLRQQLGIPPGAPVVGTVGNFKPQKSPLDLARVAVAVRARRPDVWFVLAGDGPLRPDVERFLRQTGHANAVLLPGWRRDLASLYSLMDVFYLMSLWEGLPTVVSEAKWFGVPVVATAVDGTVEVIEDGVTGFLVPPAGVPAAADRILALLSDADLRKSITASARANLLPEYDLRSAVPNLSGVMRSLFHFQNAETVKMSE
ncbi:glycosyltransferase [bacterium]|nr:glycosyltransferase [bacterium]